MDQVWHGRKVPYIEMLVIQRMVFGIVVLIHQSSSVALPETIKPFSNLPDQSEVSEVWEYPYPNNTTCPFPYIWQASVGRCCYPFFNCGPGYGIEFCREDMGNDSCVECKNSFKQYHLVHSFDGVNAMCFEVKRYEEEECIEAIKEETIPARGNYVAACGLPCECNPSNCFFGDDPCRCQIKQEKCKSNHQMNRVTGVCEACPWYSFKDKEGCGACIVNADVWMSGSSKALVPPSPQNVTVSVTTTGYLPDSTSEKINTMMTTTLLPETKNAPILTIVIIGVVMGVVCAGVVVIAVCLIKRRICHARSGASSSQYASISQVPSIAVENQISTTEYQEESETSDLINNISETNIQQSNGYIDGHPVSNNNNHSVNHKFEDHVDSHKSSESGNHLGIHGRINERIQSASTNSASPENVMESSEETHRIENIGFRNGQGNPAEQTEINHVINNIEPSNNLATAEGQLDMNCSGRQALLTTDLVDLQTGSNADQIPHHKTDNHNKGSGRLYENQNIVHAEITDPPSSILFSSDSNNPCSSNHQMEKNLDGTIKLQLKKDIEDPNYFLGTNQFMRGSPVENSHCWSFPRDNDSFTDAQPLPEYENVTQNTVSQAICTGDVDKRINDKGDVDKRINDNSSIIPGKEFNSSATRGPDLKTPNHEGGACCEDSRIPNEEPRIPSEEDHPQSPQHLTMPLSPTSPSNSSTFKSFLNGSISSSTENEAVAQDTVAQAVCTDDVDKRTNNNSSKVLVKEVVRVLPLNTNANRSLHLGAPNQESGTCSEDSRIPNEEPQIHSEEGHLQSPQCLTLPLSPTSPGIRPFLNRSISSSTDRPMAKVTPMRQEIPRQDEGTLENDDSMSTDSSTDISMSYGVVHIAGGLSLRDESSNPSLSSSCEDAPPSFSHVTDPPSTASHTQMENTGFRRTGGMRSATRNGSQVPMMGSQSRGGPDGASVPSYHRANRVVEPRQVFETDVKEPEQSEETDPKTLLSSTQERDRIELERQDSDSEDDSEKIVLIVNQTEEQEKLRDICEGLVYPGSLSDAAENSSDKVQGKTLRKDFKAMEANASHKESNLRNVPLHNDDQVQYKNSSFSSELENKLNSTARSKFDTEETCHSYSSLQDKEDIQIKTKSVEDSGKDGIFQDSKSSLEEIVNEADGFFSDTDPDVGESSSDQRSSHSDDDGVCSNGDAELNRELQQPSQGQVDLHNEFNSSSLSVNSDESGIGIEEQTIQTLQDS